MNDDVIANMQGRLDQCRRLAKSTHDEGASRILRQMADEIEADIRRLEAEICRSRFDLACDPLVRLKPKGMQTGPGENLEAGCRRRTQRR